MKNFKRTSFIGVIVLLFVNTVSLVIAIFDSRLHMIQPILIFVNSLLIVACVMAIIFYVLRKKH